MVEVGAFHLTFKRCDAVRAIKKEHNKQLITTVIKFM